MYQNMIPLESRRYECLSVFLHVLYPEEVRFQHQSILETQTNFS